MFPRLRLLVVLLAATPALAQEPAGSEFQVNTYTTRWQIFPSIAVTPAGDFVVAWRDENDGDATSISARRFDARGAALGDQFAVNTTTEDYQQDPMVVSSATGDFVVVWLSFALNGTGWNVLGQRYDAQGARRGGEFRANTVAAFNQFYPRVAMHPRGDFVVAWASYRQDGSNYGIFARRYDANGLALDAEFRVNSYTTGGQLYPAIGMTVAGDFVIAWQSRLQDGDLEGIFAQRFSAGGSPVGAEFRVNTDTIGRQWRPRIGVGQDGRFVVAWQGISGGPEGTEVRARRYDAAGNAQGGEFAVNTQTAGNQLVSGVTVDARGDFLVTWDDSAGDGSASGVLGRRFHADGSLRGSEFRVNTYTTAMQTTSAVGADRAGNFVVGWASQYQDGSSFGVFAQRFGGLIPSAVSVDAQGNGILEPGEAVDLRPSWRNVSGAAQTFGAGLSEIAGPAGPAYTITDASGAYGTVADDTTAPCEECYGVSVSDPATRPATHWDASVLESITPDAQGQQKRWALHVGKSFTDVASASPFYRFVEALLHHSVTSGCTGTQFCPAATTTREQMAVFVLVAKEGAGWAPPACAPPNLFTDVPESSPFCRWIEELANRGLVSGCGGGAYCPGAAVGRDQMAVFVLKALEPTLVPPPCSPPNLFADVPETSPFCAGIEELARRGVVSGCGDGNYCPASAVTREQMAVFLAVPFRLSLYGS